MLKKTMTYKGYDDKTYTEDFYFNLTKAECMELELGETGGLTEYINKISAAQSTPELVAIFKKIILMAYGIKSPDGKRFIKSDEISKDFSETEAYSDLFMELATDADKAAAFMNAIVPAMDDITDKVVNNAV